MVIPVSSLAAAVLFGTVTVMYLFWEVYTRLGSSPAVYSAVAAQEEEMKQQEEGNSSAAEAAPVAELAAKPIRYEALDLSSSASVGQLLQMSTQLGLILLYSWLCENLPLFPHSGKDANADHFWFLALVFLAVAFLRVDKTSSTDILNRDQTEEWKGWMQYLFLAYHYFHYGEVYNAIRVFISCYVWMTGFGNFSFFYMKGDFSWVRWWNMMWRLNFLVFFLCMVHNNTYILYYICPLHTFYFCMVYVSMRVCKGLNHNKWGVRFKVFVVGLIIYAVWELPGAFQAVFFFLPKDPVVGAGGGTQKEFHFRTSLDHWSAFYGMIFALNFPLYTVWTQNVEANFSAAQQLLIKGSVAVVLLAGAWYYAAEIYFLPKLEYNEVHPFVFILPMLAYVFVRNCTLGLRSYYLHYLGEMGKMTLETYLMQHHIWLTSNAKTLLVLVPGYPQVNSFATTLVYVFLSRRLYRLTLNLRAMLIPTGGRDSLVYLAWMAVVMAHCTLVAIVILELFGETGVAGVLVTSVLCASAVLALFKFRSAYRRPVELGLIGVTVLAVTAIVLWHFDLLGLGDQVAVPAPTPAPKPSGPVKQPDGIAQDMGLGLLQIVAAALMLGFMDNFYGLSWAALNVFGLGRVKVTYDDAYAKLNAKIKADMASS